MGVQVTTPDVLLPDDFLKWVPDPNDYGPSAATFTYKVYDGKAYSVLHVVTLDVLPVNDAAVLDFPTSVDALEDVPVAIFNSSSLSFIVDHDDEGNNLQMDISVSSGVLNAPPSALVISGTGTSILNVTGTAADTSVWLKSLTYVAEPDFNGPIGMDITITDSFTGPNTKIIRVHVRGMYLLLFRKCHIFTYLYIYFPVFAAC